MALYISIAAWESSWCKKWPTRTWWRKWVRGKGRYNQLNCFHWDFQDITSEKIALKSCIASYCGKTLTYKIVPFKSFHRRQGFFQLFVRALQTVHCRARQRSIKTRHIQLFVVFQMTARLPHYTLIHMTGWTSSHYFHWKQIPTLKAMMHQADWAKALLYVCS